jgi:hypothetical protein
MKRASMVVVLLFGWMFPAASAPGSLSDGFAKAALQTLQGIETDITTTEQGMKAIFDPVNAQAKTGPEKSVAQFLHQAYEQKLIDNRLRQAEFSVLDEALASPDPLIRDYISKEQIAQYDHDDAEMNRKETACFEPLKKALQDRSAEIPKACTEWAALAAPPATKAAASEE